jgi:hypothetical protein
VLKEFGGIICPDCREEMVQVCDVEEGAAAGTYADQQWLCNACGYSRPVVFRVARQGRLEVIENKRLVS